MKSLLFVNGTLMRGLPLHGNMVGARFLQEARTAPYYRLYSIDDVHPGMFYVDSRGVSVKGELYEVDESTLEWVERHEPPDLYVGWVTLSDGRRVKGILYPRAKAEERHRDISDYGDWRRYIGSSDSAS